MVIDVRGDVHISPVDLAAADGLVDLSSCVAVVGSVEWDSSLVDAVKSCEAY